MVAYLFSLLSERALTLIDHDEFCSWTLREIFIRKLLVNAFHLEAAAFSFVITIFFIYKKVKKQPSKK